MAKRVRISDDGGTSWYTLPGNTAELSSEAGDLDDTIFGQDFSSTQSGLIGWTISANGLFKGFAGYVAKILKPGTPTAMTAEPMGQIGTSLTFEITDPSKNVWNRHAELQVFDGGEPADVVSIDYLFGRVTLAETPISTITVTGEYLPLESIGCSNSFTLTQTANAIDNTCMSTAQVNEGHRTFEYGLKTVSLDLQGIYKTANNFLQMLKNREELVIEVNPDGNGNTVARGFYKAMTTGQSGDVGDLEQETITFNLSVPQDDTGLIPYPFHWVITEESTLSMAIQKALTAWEESEMINIAYLPDGNTGVQGEAVITDLTLTGGLEAMNEFTANVQGSGELTSYD
jgi:hypothetical protein